jgi:hypothetical protein
MFFIKLNKFNLNKINIKRMASEIPTNLLIILIFHITDIIMHFNTYKYSHRVVRDELKRLILIWLL